MFSSSWMLKGLTPFLKDSANKLLEFEDWRNKLIDKEENSLKTFQGTFVGENAQTRKV